VQEIRSAPISELTYSVDNKYVFLASKEESLITAQVWIT